MRDSLLGLDVEAAERQILALVRELVEELQPGRRALAGLSLDSLLLRELGLDSLARAELLGRIEKAFGTRLSAAVLASAETPGDLLRAVRERGATGGAREEEPGAGAVPAATADFAPAPERTRTLLAALAWHVTRNPQRRHITFLPGDGGAEELTYGDLDTRSRAVAAGLLRLGLRAGQAVGIMLPSGCDYFAAFCGTLFAGAIPVPLYPPLRKSQIEDHLERQAAILETAGAGVLITFPEVLPLARLLRGRLAAPGRLATVADLADLAASGGGGVLPELPQVGEDDIALLQFTSGSTGQPKGVVLTHANLLANLRAIGRVVPFNGEDVVVSWLPLYHDMGLIGTWMGSLYYGMPLVLLPPLSFLARPVSWLRAISTYRGTLSAAPNFAYELCAAKIPDEELAGIDLSSWNVALNGAEPVSPEALRRFSERFAPYGFRPAAMTPVYGLAECALALAFPPLGRGPRIDAIERDRFERTGRAFPLADIAAAGDPRALRFVSCGSPLPGHEVRVVDPLGHEAGEREEGVLQFRGPSATRGYFRNPEATGRLMRGAWLDSGDRGYLAEGEVFVTGRVKDIILRAGRNLYPQELEAAVGALPGVRRGCVAAFGAPDEASGTERLVVVVETRERESEARERLRAAVQAAAAELLGLPADEVVLAPPHAVPKTSSGKLRRAATRDAYLSGGIGDSGGGRGFVWQLARFAVAGWRRRLARAGRATASVLYDAWVKLALLLTILPLTLGVVTLPSLGLRRRWVRLGCRAALRLAGIPLRVTGAEPRGAGPSPTPTPRIVVANHASHMDGAVLLAALAPDRTYVVERELLGNLFTRVLLRRLGALFVERYDVAKSAREVEQLAAAVERGESLVVFPEALFRNAPGVQPFHMGAFLVAAREGVPVAPVALRGTREVLHGYAHHFRPGAVEVVLLPPIEPAGSGWPAAVALRDAARSAILGACGEPDLSPEQADL